MPKALGDMVEKLRFSDLIVPSRGRLRTLRVLGYHFHL